MKKSVGAITPLRSGKFLTNEDARNPFRGAKSPDNGLLSKSSSNSKIQNRLQSSEKTTGQIGSRLQAITAKNAVTRQEKKIPEKLQLNNKYLQTNKTPLKSTDRSNKSTAKKTPALPLAVETTSKSKVAKHSYKNMYMQAQGGVKFEENYHSGNSSAKNIVQASMGRGAQIFNKKLNEEPDLLSPGNDSKISDFFSPSTRKQQRVSKKDRKQKKSFIEGQEGSHSNSVAGATSVKSSSKMAQKLITQPLSKMADERDTPLGMNESTDSFQQVEAMVMRETETDENINAINAELAELNAKEHYLKMAVKSQEIGLVDLNGPELDSGIQEIDQQQILINQDIEFGNRQEQLFNQRQQIGINDLPNEIHNQQVFEYDEVEGKQELDIADIGIGIEDNIQSQGFALEDQMQEQEEVWQLSQSQKLKFEEQQMQMNSNKVANYSYQNPFIGSAEKNTKFEQQKVNIHGTFQDKNLIDLKEDDVQQNSTFKQDLQNLQNHGISQMAQNVQITELDDKNVSIPSLNIKVESSSPKKHAFLKGNIDIGQQEVSNGRKSRSSSADTTRIGNKIDRLAQTHASPLKRDPTNQDIKFSHNFVHREERYKHKMKDPVPVFSKKTKQKQSFIEDVSQKSKTPHVFNQSSYQVKNETIKQESSRPTVRADLPKPKQESVHIQTAEIDYAQFISQERIQALVIEKMLKPEVANIQIQTKSITVGIAQIQTDDYKEETVKPDQETVSIQTEKYTESSLMTKEKEYLDEISSLKLIENALRKIIDGGHMEKKIQEQEIESLLRNEKRFIAQIEELQLSEKLHREKAEKLGSSESELKHLRFREDIQKQQIKQLQKNDKECQQEKERMKIRDAEIKAKDKEIQRRENELLAKMEGFHAQVHAMREKQVIEEREKQLEKKVTEQNMVIEILKEKLAAYMEQEQTIMEQTEGDDEDNEQEIKDQHVIIEQLNMQQNHTARYSEVNGEQFTESQYTDQQTETDVEGDFNQTGQSDGMVGEICAMAAQMVQEQRLVNLKDAFTSMSDRAERFDISQVQQSEILNTSTISVTNKLNASFTSKFSNFIGRSSPDRIKVGNGQEKISEKMVSEQFSQTAIKFEQYSNSLTQTPYNLKDDKQTQSAGINMVSRETQASKVKSVEIKQFKSKIADAETQTVRMLSMNVVGQLTKQHQDEKITKSAQTDAGEEVTIETMINDFEEKVDLIILSIDMDNYEIQQTVQSGIKNLQELLQYMVLKLKMKSLTDQPYICILKKRLFRTNCNNDAKKEAYCRLIAHSYQKKLLAKELVQIKQQAGKADFYTFIIDNEPKTLAYKDDIAQQYAYAKSTIMAKNGTLHCIECDMLKYNMEDVERQKKSIYASGHFIVKECGMFSDVYSNRLEDYGIKFK